MPRYYCDYCDTYLTHDSPSVRKQHNAGYKHKANVREYYQQFEAQQTQSLIDQKIKEHLGQTAAFQQQVGATFQQHLAGFPAQRPRLPILPTPVMPISGPPQPGVNSQLMPTVRPVMQPPLSGYGAAPPTAPQLSLPPGSTSLLAQANGLPRPPMTNIPLAPVSSVPSSDGVSAAPNP